MFQRPSMCIGQLTQDATVLWAIDVAGLCSNIPHSQGRATLQKFLELRDYKQISSDYIKKNIFEFDEKASKQIRGATIETKFTPSYAILFMAD